MYIVYPNIILHKGFVLGYFFFIPVALGVTIKIMKKILTYLNNDNDFLALCDSCKSSSGYIGYALRSAHYKLGEVMATTLYNDRRSNEITIGVLMRAGFFFALGVADKLEQLGVTVHLVLIEKNKIEENDLQYFTNQNENILIDAVINTGKSIFDILNQVKISCKIVTTVIPENSLYLFDKYEFYSVRISKNQYKGEKVSKILNGKGPDTGDRLYNTL